MLAWYEPESRNLALLATLRVAQEWLGLRAIEHVEIVSTRWALGASAADISEFLRVAPAVLNYEYHSCVFELWLNGSPTGFELNHLDQLSTIIQFSPGVIT